MADVTQQSKFIKNSPQVGWKLLRISWRCGVFCSSNDKGPAVVKVLLVEVLRPNGPDGIRDLQWKLLNSTLK